MGLPVQYLSPQVLSSPGSADLSPTAQPEGEMPWGGPMGGVPGGRVGHEAGFEALVATTDPMAISESSESVRVSVLGCSTRQ